jgi:CheY-like chemotaxis protein
MKGEKLIMLIDDNQIDNFIHKTFLQSREIADNFVVIGTAFEAIGYLSNQKDISKIPDLILLDINLPAVSGHDFLKEFEEFPAAIKNKTRIIVLSSSDKEEDMIRMNNNPFVKKFLLKPLTEESLKSIKACLND